LILLAHVVILRDASASVGMGRRRTALAPSTRHRQRSHQFVVSRVVPTPAAEICTALVGRFDWTSPAKQALLSADK
jgi:hypothetical protein